MFKYYSRIKVRVRVRVRVSLEISLFSPLHVLPSSERRKGVRIMGVGIAGVGIAGVGIAVCTQYNFGTITLVVSLVSPLNICC